MYGNVKMQDIINPVVIAQKNENNIVEFLFQKIGIITTEIAVGIMRMSLAIMYGKFVANETSAKGIIASILNLALGVCPGNRITPCG